MKQGHRKHERGGGDSHEIPSCELGQFSDFNRVRIINMRAQHITFSKAIKTVLKDCKEF